jgi:FHA domain
MSDPASSTPSVPSAPSVPSVQTHRPLPVPGTADGAERLRPLAPPSPSDTDADALAPRAALSAGPGSPPPASASERPAGSPPPASASAPGSGPASGAASGPTSVPTGGTGGTTGENPGTGSGGAGNGGQWTCPHCSAVLEKEALFCEVCGYDPSTGSLPHVYAPVIRPAVLPGAPSDANGPSSTSFGTPSSPSVPSTPAQVIGRWIATISADRAYYDSHQVGDVQFPLGVPPRSIELPGGPISIGRRSRSRGTNPAIDLAGPPEDPAVSHTHASLLPAEGAAWTLIDHGSTNGTYVNESLDPVAANQPLRIAPGDRVYVGAWTRITLELHPHH